MLICLYSRDSKWFAPSTNSAPHSKYRFKYRWPERKHSVTTATRRPRLIINSQICPRACDSNYEIIRIREMPIRVYVCVPSCAPSPYETAQYLLKCTHVRGRAHSRIFAQCTRLMLASECVWHLCVYMWVRARVELNKYGRPRSYNLRLFGCISFVWCVCVSVRVCVCPSDTINKKWVRLHACASVYAAYAMVSFGVCVLRTVVLHG